MFLVENDGDSIVKTDYWTGHHYAKKFCFLSKGLSQWRLLIPESLEWMFNDIWAGKGVIVEKSFSNDGCIDLKFPDGTRNPFKISLDKRLVDKELISEDCEMMVWSKRGPEIKLRCKIRIAG